MPMDNVSFAEADERDMNKRREAERGVRSHAESGPLHARRLGESLRTKAGGGPGCGESVPVIWAPRILGHLLKEMVNIQV